ncbi:MAG: capsular biosynthesis protein [Bacteroidales bacterium]|nr:capsular biosynthesis protein [Bacteroidales bacterium]
MITDYHSHVLPGVDDGVRTVEESLSVLERLAGEGVEQLWLTPHIMEDVPNTTENLKQRFEALRQQYKGPIVLHLAAEYMMDSLFMERLEADDLLPLGEERRHILVETSCWNPPMDIYGILERIRSKGYFPVLAHPERYFYMSSKDYKTLHSSGVVLQLNLPSLGKAYGSEVYKKARWLLRHGLYTIAGSDIHRERMVDTILSYKHPGRVLPLLQNKL